MSVYHTITDSTQYLLFILIYNIANEGSVHETFDTLNIEIYVFLFLLFFLINIIHVNTSFAHLMAFDPLLI